MLLQEMMDNFLVDVEVTSSNGTFRFYKSHLNYMINYFKDLGKIYSEQIGLLDLNQYILFAKNSNLSNNTINKRILVIKKMFEFNSLSEHQIFNTKKLKQPENHFNCLSNKEIKSLIKYIESDSLHLKSKLIIYMLLDTGIRVNELCHIKIKNINFNNNSIFLDVTKTLKSRNVYFTDLTKKILLEYLAQYETDIYLFDISQSGISSLFARIKKTCNFDKFHPHMLRHSFATILNSNGADTFTIMSLMGHSNIQTTERYIHLTENFIKKSYNNYFKIE